MEQQIKKMLVIGMGMICFMLAFKMANQANFGGTLLFGLFGFAVLWTFLDLSRGGRTVVMDGDKLPDDVKREILEKLKKMDLEDCGDPECEIHGDKKKQD